MANVGNVGDTATLIRRKTGDNAAHVLVIEAGSSRIFPLPVPGVVTIGRGEEAELRVDHASVSRRHARITLQHDEVRIADLDSHNGTLVNGTRLREDRTLVTGDVVAVGEVILVVHAEIDRVERTILDEKSWWRRLTAEVERAVSFQRPLAVLAVANTGLFVPPRPIDILTQAPDRILVVLPEADPSTARALAGELLARLLPSSPEVQIGIACCPGDAIDPEGLVSLASSAGQSTAPGSVGSVERVIERRTLGDRTIVICDPAMVRVFDLLKRLGAAELPVLIIGETGAGKEAAAYAVHHHSRRSAGPFAAVNCAAFSETLVDSQLFGHDKGAFTGANAARPGVFESTSGGTLFLDELGELSLAAQAKLLRALDTQRIMRLGETKERVVDVRLVAATNRNLEQEVAAGRFRQDLYFRLGAARVHIPPLRERRCEIPVLFRELVAMAAARLGRTPPETSPLVVQRLLAHSWPGNVRELRHVAEYLLATIEDDRIEPEDLPDDLAVQTALPSPAPPLERTAPMRKLSEEIDELERARMVEALGRTNGVKTHAAALLGMPIRTFNSKIKQHGIS
jgi:two-component system, NtrC family, response regulator AtoC